LHKQGKGMMGMTEFTSVNSDIGMKTVSTFDLNATWFIPYLSQQKTYIGDNLTHSQTTDYTYVTSQVGGTGSKRFLSLPQTVVKTDVLWNNSLTSSYNSYDNFGNVSGQVVTTKNNGTTEGITTTTTTYTGANNNPALCDYLPKLVTVDIVRGIEPTISVETDHEYSSTGLLLETVNFNDEDCEVTTEFEYDDFGNPDDVTISATGVTSRQSSTTYDTRGRFALSQTNPLLWTESFEYDHRTGQVLKATDVNGLVTKYKYDGFGRARLTEYPDGINLIEKIKWYTGQDVSNARYYTQAQATGSPPVKAWYDRVGCELQTQSTDFAGDYVYATMEYDSKGRKWKVSEPCDDPDNATQFTTFAYDNLGRMYQTTLPTGVKLITDFSGIANNEISTYKQHTSSIWDNVTKTMNAFGEPISVEDEGGTITYTYTLDDPDATPGTQKITTVYNAFDELISQTDGRGKSYTMAYDKLGRITTRTGTETTTWTYSTVAGHLGELTSVSCNNNTSQSFAYDMLGRLTSQTENILGESFTQYYTYDDLGRLHTQSWNTGFGIKHKYNSHGYLDKIQTAIDQTIWEAETYNLRGQITEYKLGDDYRTTRNWDSYGFPSYIKTQTTAASPDDRQREGYNFDEKRGNLTQRSLWEDEAHFEDFRYDDLQRLVADSLGSTDYRNTAYAANGNITNRSDVGDYTYGDYGPHAVSGLEETTGSLLPSTNQTVDYTDFNKASHISQGSLDYFITYGHDRLRRKTTLLNGATDDVLLTKYYAFGDYEKENGANGTRHLHYISGGDGLAAIYIKYSSGEDSLYYVIKAHLGSLVGLINSESGKVYRQSFDAWGRNRNPEDWTYTSIPDDFPIARGYTGHEHLKWFGLINMNGRMYDAGLCRFLTPDPYVQMPDYSQNFNRYSYCLNNPLKYSDPSGEWIHLVIGAAIGGTLNVIFNAGNIDNFWDGLGYFGVGAAAGALAAGVGAGVGVALAGNAAAGGGFAAGFLGTASISSTGFVAGAISGAAAGVTNGLMVGTGNGMMSGQNFTDAFMDGGLDKAWKQGLSGAAVGGVLGGIDAVSSERNFWTGSPKENVVGNRMNLTSQNDYNRSSTDVKNNNDVYIPEKHEPFSMEIEVDGMKEITTSTNRFPSNNPAYIDKSFSKNVAVLDFPAGTNTEGYVSLQGWSWAHSTRNSIFPSSIIYSKVSRHSSIFFYLKYLKLK
jgi:RHS repeat-associated protein